MSPQSLCYLSAGINTTAEKVPPSVIAAFEPQSTNALRHTSSSARMQFSFVAGMLLTFLFPEAQHIVALSFIRDDIEMPDSILYAGMKATAT